MINREKARVIVGIIICIILILCMGCGQGKNEDKKNTDGRNQPVAITSYPVDENDVEYVTWAVPGNLICISDESVNKVNSKLKDDGYTFRLKLLRIENSYDKGYIDELERSGADIVFTGIGVYDSSDRLAIDEIISGKYEDLTEYIENSRLKALIPQKLLDASSYKGKMYLLPSEYIQDGADQILLYKGGNDASTLSFDGIDSDVFMLEELVSENNKLFYGFTDFEFVRCFGYCYDSGNGIVISNEGQIINPFEDEKCLRWMQLVNTWYKEGIAPDPRDGNPTVIKAKCTLHLTTSSDITREKGQVVKTWKRELCNRYGWSTAIRKDSGHKENAFKFLELIRTDHGYGNLLIYGKLSEDEGPIDDNYMNKVVFGLDDGLMQPDDGMRHFASSQERLKYYEENVLVSPTVYVDIPVESSELSGIVKKYLTNDIILFHNEFESEFEAFKSEYTEAFDRILKNNR